MSDPIVKDMDEAQRGNTSDRYERKPGENGRHPDCPAIGKQKSGRRDENDDQADGETYLNQYEARITLGSMNASAQNRNLHVSKQDPDRKGYDKWRHHVRLVQYANRGICVLVPSIRGTGSNM